jgi:hypothetical protein
MSNEEDQDVDTELLELEADLRDRLRIDPMALEQEFVRAPANIAYLGNKHAQAIGAHLRAKIRVKKLWGLVLMQARENLEQENEENQQAENASAAKSDRKPKDVKVRITESMVEARAHQMKMWQDAQEDEVNAEVAREVAKANFEAIRAKKDMLVQLGATFRAEMERDPVVRDRLRVQRGE